MPELQAVRISGRSTDRDQQMENRLQQRTTTLGFRQHSTGRVRNETSTGGKGCIRAKINPKDSPLSWREVGFQVNTHHLYSFWRSFVRGISQQVQKHLCV